MIKFSPTVPVRFFARSSTYVAGEGQSTTWVDLGVLYCEWRGSYGDRVTAAQALGVNDSATVRTFYHPEIYQMLRTVQVAIIKNADPAGLNSGVPDQSNANVYELWSGVDNVGESCQFMEFRVRRYEGK